MFSNTKGFYFEMHHRKSSFWWGLTWRWSTAPTGAGGCLWSWSIPITYRPSIREHKEARSQPRASCWVVEQTWDAGGEGSVIHRWLSWLGFLFNSTLHPTLWLSSTMCSSDSCSSETLGLGKHVCYADSRTTNFTRLTSRPSVRLCTNTTSYFWILIHHMC